MTKHATLSLAVGLLHLIVGGSRSALAQAPGAANAQVNLLSNLTAWIVANDETAKTIRASLVFLN